MTRTRRREDDMRRFILRLAVVLVLGLPGLGARGDEEKVPLDKAPKPVLEAVKARFADAKITGVTKEKEDGKTVYEVTIKDKGQNVDVTVTPEGVITLIEKTITAKDLPKAVLKTLEDRYPKATYKIIEEIIKVEKKEEKLVYYEVLLETAEKKKREAQISPEGKFLKEENKDGEKED